MDAERNKRVMQDVLAAMAQGDARPFLDAMADDFCWTISGATPWSGIYRGKQAVIAELFRPLGRLLAGPITQTARRFVSEGDVVVVECRGHAVTTGSAVRAGFKSQPGVAARALHLVPGTMSREEILASVPEALFVQSVSGLHSGTNPVSGDFSVGAEGLMVRDGELAEPVREITIASTLQRMLQDVVHVGADLEWLPGGAAGVMERPAHDELVTAPRHVAHQAGCVRLADGVPDPDTAID